MTIVNDTTNRAERRRQAREAASKTIEATAQEPASVGAGRAAAIDAEFAPKSIAKPIPEAAKAPPMSEEEAARIPAPGEKPLPAAALNPPLDEEEAARLPRPGSKPIPAIIGTVGTNAPAPRAKPLTKAQAKVKAAQDAREQAYIDSLRMPGPAPDNYRPGDTIPLHILNQRAQQADAEARDEASEIGKAVGKFAEQQVSTRVPKSVMRSKRMRDAQDLMHRQRAQGKKD